jgi:hypothetical protein
MGERSPFRQPIDGHALLNQPMGEEAFPAVQSAKGGASKNVWEGTWKKKLLGVTAA